MTTAPAFHRMSLDELAKWVVDNNGRNGVTFDEMPATDELDDDEQAAAREEYESMADQLFHTTTKETS